MCSLRTGFMNGSRQQPPPPEWLTDPSRSRWMGAWKMIMDHLDRVSTAHYIQSGPRWAGPHCAPSINPLSGLSEKPLFLHTMTPPPSLLYAMQSPMRTFFLSLSTDPAYCTCSLPSGPESSCRFQRTLTVEMKRVQHRNKKAHYLQVLHFYHHHHRCYYYY